MENREMTEAERILAESACVAETVSKIRERFSHVVFPEPVLEPIYYGRFDKTKVTNRKLVLDVNTGHQMDIVSDAYVLHRHEVMVNDLLEACPEEFGAPKVDIRIMRAGAVASVEAVFPEIGKFQVNGSAINPRIMLMNSYDRSRHLGFSWGARELVCTNGLVAFRERAGGKFKHISGSLGKAQIEMRVRGAMEEFSDQVGIWNEWSKTQIDVNTGQEIMEALDLSEAARKVLIDLPLMNDNGRTLRSIGKDLTLWNVTSAVTQFAQHEVESDVRRLDLEVNVARIANNYVGV